MAYALREIIPRADREIELPMAGQYPRSPGRRPTRAGADADELAFIRARAPGCTCARPCVTYRAQEKTEKWHHYNWSYGLRVALLEDVTGTRWSHKDAALNTYAQANNLTDDEVCEQLATGKARLYQSSTPSGWRVCKVRGLRLS